MTGPSRESAPSGTQASYRERLGVPLRWWVQTTMLLASVWLAFIVATPAWLAWTVTGVIAALSGGLLLWFGAARVTVADGVLRVGRARIELDYLGPAEALDRDQTRAALGVDADARAFLCTRPYLKRSVRVPVEDPTDPTPYWLISTRHPQRLVAALGGG